MPPATPMVRLGISQKESGIVVLQSAVARTDSANPWRSIKFEPSCIRTGSLHCKLFDLETLPFIYHFVDVKVLTFKASYWNHTDIKPKPTKSPIGPVEILPETP